MRAFASSRPATASTHSGWPSASLLKMSRVGCKCPPRRAVKPPLHALHLGDHSPIGSEATCFQWLGDSEQSNDSVILALPPRKCADLVLLGMNSWALPALVSSEYPSIEQNAGPSLYRRFVQRSIHSKIERRKALDEWSCFRTKSYFEAVLFCPQLSIKGRLG